MTPPTSLIGDFAAGKIKARLARVKEFVLGRRAAC
jgi:hypothetical protein